MVTQAPRATALNTRPYRDEDEPELLHLLSETLGGGPAGHRPVEFFRWKHWGNPFGRSYMRLAEADGRIVGLRAFMRWRFKAGDRYLRAVRAVDTATHPEYQGRGIFSRLTREAVNELREEAQLIFNTPNEQSLPGYLKMGWRIVGTVPVSVRIRRPLRFVRGFRDVRSSSRSPGPRPNVSAVSVADALAYPEIPALLSEAAEASDQRLATRRDVAYLRWRYGAAPLLDYRAVLEHARGELVGIAMFRIRPRGVLWETTVAEVIAREGDKRTARRLFRKVIAACPVDHLACHFPKGSTSSRAALEAGFLRAPGGIMFVANQLDGEMSPEPTQLRSWALSLGDLEVF